MTDTLTISPEQLEFRKELMLAALNDWTETVDPWEHGHVEHGAEGHIGRHLVHTISKHGFGADWDYEAAVAYIRAAKEVGAAIEPIEGRPRLRSGHIYVLGADDRFIAFDCKAER